MTFAKEQVDKLREPLDRRYVKQRKQGGSTLSYIEGWKAIEYANSIFGHDGWDRETVYTECVYQGEREGYRAKYACAYTAKVRVTVRAGDAVVVREGTGSGSGFGANPGEAHESAIKEAETDAMKRALMTFGWRFGLALYDKDQEHVTDGEEEPLEEETPVEAHVETAPVPPKREESLREPTERDPQKELSEWADRALTPDAQKRLSLTQRKALSRTRALCLAKVEEIYKEKGETFNQRAWIAKALGIPVDSVPEHLAPLDSGITDRQLRDLEQEAKAFLARVKERAAEAKKSKEVRNV